MADRLSSLPDAILLLILSSLPFRENLRSSLLSRRWGALHRESRNIAFKDTEFVTGNEDDSEETKRHAFMFYLLNWTTTFLGSVIESFQLCFVNPYGYGAHIQYVIEFVVSKKVKNLILEFSDPRWVFNHQAREVSFGMISVPESLYKLNTLESLKLSFCQFDPTRFENPRSLIGLCVCWTELRTISSFLLRTPLLECLRIKTCWDVGLEAITGVNEKLNRLVFKDNSFLNESTTLNLPSIEIFKYCGILQRFVFETVNDLLEEVSLHYWLQADHDETTGTILREYLYHLAPATTMTFCPFVIQMIQDTVDPLKLQIPTQALQLNIKTNFQANEFVGIKCLINSSPNLEILTFQQVAAAPLTLVALIDPDAYWTVDTDHTCLKESLKAIEVWNFTGSVYQLHVLRFLIRNSLILERVDLYLYRDSVVVREEARIAAETVVPTFPAGSGEMQVYVHSD